METDSGYLPLQLLGSFYRVQSLTSSIELVQSAVRESDLLQLSGDEKFIRRREEPEKWPIPDILNINMRNNYIEGFNPNVPEFVPRKFLSEFLFVYFDFIFLGNFPHGGICMELMPVSWVSRAG
jgi:hypothetical protein